MALGTLAGIALFALVAFLLIKKASTRIIRARNESRNDCLPPPRYPHRDPVLGLDLFYADFQAMRDGKSLAVQQERFARIGKTFEVNSWGTRLLYTMDRENTRAVHADSFRRFGVQPLRLHVGSPFIGKGVFTTDGPDWEHSRSLIRPMFTRAQISDFKQLDSHVDRLLERIPRDGSTVELQSLLKLMFLDHATEMIFGKSTDTLLHPELGEEANELLRTYNAALTRLGLRLLLGRIRLLGFWDRTYARLAQRIHRVLDKYIDAALERQQQQQSNSEPKRASRYVIIDELVAAMDDRSEIRHHLLNIFLPARDGIAIGLAGVLFHLARHPRAWNKLRAEVLSLNAAEPITYQVLQSMEYMKAVINESLRLLTPSGQNVRICLQDAILPRGGGPDGKAPIYMSQGDQISVNFDAMHRDPDLWGEDAYDFRPERWLEETEHQPAGKPGAKKPGWSYIPFSGGPRVCPGQQITLTESAYVLVRLMRAFERMENRDPEPRFIEESRLTVESRNGVLVSMISPEG